MATRAGVGISALYRRWSGKRELVVAALRADAEEPVAAVGSNPVDDLVAALVRVSEAVDHGLGALVAACLREPGSEIAAVTREATLVPMGTAIRAHLGRCIGPAADLSARAAIGPALILWQAASIGGPLDETAIRGYLLPLLGLPGPRAAVTRGSPRAVDHP